MDIFLQDTSQDAQYFSDQVITFMAAVNSQVKLKPHG